MWNIIYLYEINNYNGNNIIRYWYYTMCELRVYALGLLIFPSMNKFLVNINSVERKVHTFFIATRRIRLFYYSKIRSELTHIGHSCITLLNVVSKYEYNIYYINNKYILHYYRLFTLYFQELFFFISLNFIKIFMHDDLQSLYLYL